LTSVKIKSIVTRYGSIEEYILQRIERLHETGKIKSRLYGFSIDMPLTSNPNSVVKLKREKDHLSFTVVDIENRTIINDYIYHWVCNKNYVQFYTKFHKDLLDFYNWYCKAVYEEKQYIRDFVTYNNLDNMLHYYNLYKTYFTIFNQRIVAVKDPTKELQMPSKLRNIIERFDKYKKLFEAGTM